MPKTYTSEDLKPVVDRIIFENPAERNPTIDLGCAYTSADGQYHCLVGQVAHELGWEVPDSTYNGLASMAASEFGWPVSLRGAEYLDYIQRQADRVVPDGGRRPWGDVDTEVDPQH